jgi:uncharacterized lipoprotein YajG
MNNALKFISSLFAILIVTGCATNRSNLNLEIPKSQSTQSNGKQVYVKTVSDMRVFQVNPRSPDIPSLDPSEDQNDQIKLRAIGRKRNAYGKALGDILLKEGETVQLLANRSIQQAFLEKGYTVLNSKDQITKDTYIVDANIQKFWAWMNPGFWQITLSSEISTELAIKHPKGKSSQQISVKAADGFQVATEANWTEVIQKSMKLYIDDLKTKLD